VLFTRQKIKTIRKSTLSAVKVKLKKNLNVSNANQFEMRNISYQRPGTQDQNLLEQTHTPANVTKLKSEKIQMYIDVHHFGPHDITVKTIGNTVVIEGRHKKRFDEFGIIGWHFVPNQLLPEANLKSDIQSTLSSDGVLTVTILAPAKIENKDEEYQTVLIIHRIGPLHLSLHKFHKEKFEKPTWKN
jgi:HSP20 family molecular chaperone IbpA